MTDPELLHDRPRPAVRIARRFNHPIERVWDAVTQPEQLAQWFPSEVEIDLRPGGAIRFGAFDDGAAHGRVLELDAPRWLSFTWDTDELQFELHPDGGGTLFVLTHLFNDRPGAASFATGWEACLAGLLALLDGAPAHGRRIERHEELVSRFGLDQPEISRTGDGWTARFERQLTCPAETAWNIFFGGDPVSGGQCTAPAVGAEFRPSAAPEVLLGIVTEVDPPHTFGFTVAPDEPGDQVSLHLGAGTGHGARLVLVVRGSNDDELGAAIEQWGAGAIAHVARQAARLALTGAS